MGSDPAERVAMHIVRHLVRGLRRIEGQGVSIQRLKHWWTISLGQRNEDFERGLAYAGTCRWIERGADDVIVLTNRGSEKGGTLR